LIYERGAITAPMGRSSMSLSIHARWLGLCLCVAALAQAQTTTAAQVDVPAGDLVTALDSLAQQTGAQFVYRADQLRGLKTAGVRGDLTADAALAALLKGSGFAARKDTSGAMVIVKDNPAGKVPEKAPTPAAPPSPTPETEPAPVEMETFVVTGSRIPRVQIEGAAPITVITAAEIKSSGLTTVPDVMRAITQNSGETQSQQSLSGADFSPGAQQVDLRGLGPNHTLVLVNGRRIADFPMPFKGRSNFADISNIPLGMVDRIEVLTGSASAIYGSDAVSGVVNFILKKQADGTTLNFRYGDTTRGGGESYNLSLASGFARGDFNAVFGAELQNQTPLWAFERDIQDSTLDGPTSRSRLARRDFLRTNYYDEYLDPGQSTCAALSHLSDNSTMYSVRPGWGVDGDDGFYCGSTESIGYGTIITERKGINAYGSLTYDLGNDKRWFADLQLGYHQLGLYRDVTHWSYQAPDGNEEGYFFNQATDQIEYWQRQFSPEEMGGLDSGKIKNDQKTFSIATGITGNFAERWDYEAAFSHAQYTAKISWPQIIAANANNLFLGPQLGVDEDGYAIFNADPDRLYTPLTRAEYDAIAKRTVYHPESNTDTLSFTLTNGELFSLPAGPVGFASVVEVGTQSYDLNPDPLATQYYYYSWKDSDGHGSRNRWALASELRAPLHETVNVTAAARYDQYHYAGNDIGKLTYSAGLEWRPVETLLLRSSYGTAFRAPDLHYVFAGVGNDETSGTSYFDCYTEHPNDASIDCTEDFDEDLIRTRQGNRDLDPETSTSWTAGLVFSPTADFDITLDYFDIQMRDQVLDMRVEAILRTESRCRLGPLDPRNTPSDTPVATSTDCLNAIARVVRNNGRLVGILVGPENVAREDTSGVDANARYRINTDFGDFRLGLSHTWVREHNYQQFDDSPVEDQFAVNSGFDIPRTKTSATLSWSHAGWSAGLHGQRLGRLPNSDSYDEVYEEEDGSSPWIGATYRYNATLGYEFNEQMQVSLAVTNLFDKQPPDDPSYTAYPYYDVSWFDSLGRSYYLDFTYNFGGSSL
jgi:iron complex outermembrane recepter protein